MALPKKPRAAAEPQAVASQIDETAPVLERAVEVIGDRENAFRWLGYAPPMSLPPTAQGKSVSSPFLRQD